MITHKYRSLDVAVEGGSLRVGVWDPIEVSEGAAVPSVLAVHGITSSHLAWPLVVSQLPGTRVIAPDLRGRGSSRDVEGPAGMRAHAADLVAVLDALGVDALPVVGHSMGAFVAVVLARFAPSRVSRLVLVDGGLPLDAPAGLEPAELVQAILGPTAERLSMRFASVADYLGFWRGHPAFAGDWTPELETYFAYDLAPAGDELRSATSLRVTTEDTIDMNGTTVIADALDALAERGRPVLLVTVPRGLRDETPGLYAPEHLARMLERYPVVRHEPLPDLNHYTVVLGSRGAQLLGGVLRAELSASPPPRPARG